MSDKPRLIPAELPEDDEDEEPGEEHKEEAGGLPEKWKSIDFQALAEEGWVPTVGKRDGHEYIILRLRYSKDGQRVERSKSLGPFTPSKWEYVQKVLPLRTPRIEPPPTPLMRSAVVKSIPSSVSFQAEVLQWYWLMQENAKVMYGEDLTFQEFLNDTVLSYFREKGLHLAVRVEAPPDIKVGLET